jgi:hypothetical protein
MASAPDDPKLNVIAVPGWADWNLVPSWPKAAESDDAAETVIDPVSFGRVVVVVFADPFELPQAAAARARAASHPATRTLEVVEVGCGRLLMWLLCSSQGYLHHDAGRLDHRGGEVAFFEPEVVGSLPGEEGDDPETTGADLDDGGEGITFDPGDHAAESVPGRLGEELIGGVGLLLLTDESGEGCAVHHPVAAFGTHGLEPALVAPAADGVGADPEEIHELTRSVLGHGQ